MRKKMCMWLLGSLLSVVTWAQNYPFRSDVLWVTTPSSPDWTYKVGEKATVEVQLFKYGIPQAGVEVFYELGGELMPADVTGKVTLKHGKAVIPVGTMNRPGFRDCKLTAEIDGKRYRHHVKVGYSPQLLAPYTQMPDDFVSFWQKELSALAAFPLKYTKERVDKYCTETIDCHLVKLYVNKYDRAVYGYLFQPKAPGNYPVVLCPPGAGVKTIKEPMRRAYYPENGFIRFEIEIHGLNPEWSDEMFKEISHAFSGRENGYLVNGLDNRDNYYMKQVYLACVRSLDFLAALPAWDGKNMAVQGGSQGGALAMVAAALDKRVTACVANHPALSDMAGYLDGRAGGYPHFFTKFVGMDTPEKIATMAYYDVVNFAKLITAPTRLTWGYNDDVCPATTSHIVYNVLTCPKEALVTPINEHWTSEDTEFEHMRWIQTQLK